MKRHLCMICLVFIVVLGSVMKLYPVSSPPFKFGDEQVITITGKVYRKEIKSNQSIFYLEDAVRLPLSDSSFSQKEFNETNQQNIGKVLCYTKYGSNTEKLPHIGSIVQVKGYAERLKQASNPGEFDVAAYYESQGIYCCIQNAEVLSEGAKYYVLRENLWQIGQCFGKVYDKCMNAADASVMKAMLLGQKGELATEQKKLYQAAGIAHVLAISGLHISVIGRGLYKLLQRIGLPIWLAAIGGMGFLLMYVFVSGMSASSLRAVCMFFISLLADVVGRTYDMLTAMAVAAVLLLLEEPLYLQQSGFLLSFGAILGICTLMPMFACDVGSRATATKVFFTKTRNGFWMSVSVTLMTFPIQLSSYYSICVYSIFLNLLIIPCMSVVLYVGVLGLMAGLWSVTAGSFVLWICHLVLLFYEWCCKCVLQLPGSVWVTGCPMVWQIVLYYGLLFGGIFLWYRFDKPTFDGRKRVFLAVWIVVLVVVLTIRRTPDTRITFLDVGQGDSIVMQSDSGHIYLIDGGSSSKRRMGEYQLVPYLKYCGIDTIDCAFISHLDEDHYSGILELLEDGDLEGITVRKLIVSEAEIRDDAYDRLCKLAEEAGAEVLHMRQGERLQDGSITIECIYPGSMGEDAAVARERNEISLGLVVRYKGFLGVFMGDLGIAQEKELLNSIRTSGNRFDFLSTEKLQQAECIVLKVGHHGSRNATGEHFLTWLQPDVAVISCGENNSYGHPHPETLKRLEACGCQVVTTPTHGAITIEIGEEIQFTGWR